MNSFFKTTRSTAISSSESYRSIFNYSRDNNENHNGVSDLMSNND